MYSTMPWTIIHSAPILALMLRPPTIISPPVTYNVAGVDVRETEQPPFTVGER